MTRNNSFRCQIAVAAMILTTSIQAVAEVPEGYYDRAEGLNKGELLDALESIVGDHTDVGYKKIWDVFKESDVRDDGTIWDMYATTKFKPGTDQCGNYSGIGDCYNREHSMPKSWFDEASPMKSDAFHLYPTDGYVNNQRGNYPFGECANGRQVASSGDIKPLGKLGQSTFPGYSGTVFEPDDQYKGDFARSYFYMAAAYNSLIDDWHSDQLAGDSYPCFSSWSVEMLMKWHREDPVSEKEIDRNEVIYKWQHNRNPFIDHPELAEYIWGDSKDEGWIPGGVTEPAIIKPADGEVSDLGITAVGHTISATLTIKGAALTQDLAISQTGDTGFSISPSNIPASDANAGAVVTVSFKSLQAGTYEAAVSVSSNEVKSTFTVRAEVVAGIPALPATNVTTDSFTANWICIDDDNADYTLSVKNIDADAPVAGFPVTVKAGNESYNVTGLDYNTRYSYTLTSANSHESNVVEVTTADVAHILQFETPTSLEFSATPGIPSDEQQISVYTEYIYDPITVTATGNFEMSLDHNTWANSLTLDPDGETFYLRMKATQAEGSYSGILSMKSGIYESPEVDLSGTVAALRPFFEDFEWTGYPGSYYVGQFEGNACLWQINGMYLASSSEQDHPNGKYCARLRKSKGGSMEMAEDKANGAGTLTFLGAAYKDDEDSDVAVSYSTDGGASWTIAGTATLTAGNSLKEYTIRLNVPGSVRLRFEQQSGDRINIDDIEITDCNQSAIGEAVADGNGWDAFATAPGQITITSAEPCQINIYTADALQVFSGLVTGRHTMNLNKGIYIVVCGNRSKKVIIK